jgi:UDP-N-acetylmuramoylalanine--D-glutamate ligase
VDYRDKRVVILGLARQGSALARYLLQAGAHVVISDMQSAASPTLAASLAALKDLPIEFVLGGHPPSLLDGADLLCLSGGVSADLPLAQEALRRGVPLSNDSQIFLEACPPGVKTLGITGSAGKTTTTTLVGRILVAANRAPSVARVWVGGNIGNPLIAEVNTMRAGDMAVMELSSFQLEIMTRSPQVAAVLNLTPNHLDRHGTMEAYAEAKSHILLHQSAADVALLGLDDPGACGFAPLVRGRLRYFSAESSVDEGACLKGENIVLRMEGHEQTACAVSDIRLRGRHNLQNVLAACAIGGAAGATPDAMREAVRAFTGVEHRLEFVLERERVKWYDDSIASAPERVIAALNSFDEPVVLLAGGRDKKLPWDEFARLARTRLRHLVLFGEAGPLIQRAVESAGLERARYTLCANLAEAVQVAARRAQAGDVVLLSPGGTSFDEFKDFAERGERFKEWVRAL